MPEGVLDLSSGKIHYHRFGQGKKILLALHGFAGRGRIFKSLEISLKDQITLYAPDLPFHGNTQWSREFYTQKDLVELVDAILILEGKSTLQILGYSLGGRLIMSALSALCLKLEKVYLVAPDGLGTRWMSIPEHLPLFARRGFKKGLLHPQCLLSFSAFCHRIKLVDPFVHRYLSHHLHLEDRRLRLYHTWLSLSHFKVNKTLFRKAKEQYPNLPLIFIIGNKDHLINSKKIQSLAHGLPYTEVIVTDKGHHLIEKSLAEWIN